MRSTDQEGTHDTQDHDGRVRCRSRRWASPPATTRARPSSVGEEVDEAVDTIKNGGQESAASKLDDAVDDIREGAKDAADEVKKTNDAERSR